MAEQKAAAKFLVNKEAIAAYTSTFKTELELRLRTIYDGFQKLKKKGYNVDAITPQAAMYLTIKIDVAGKKDGAFELATQKDVSSYLLTEAKLAIVPFYAFGADTKSPWYRLSVGTAKLEEIPQMFAQLEAALARLS